MKSGGGRERRRRRRGEVSPRPRRGKKRAPHPRDMLEGEMKEVWKGNDLSRTSPSLSFSLILSFFLSLSIFLSLSLFPHFSLLRPARIHVENTPLFVYVCMCALQKYRRRQVRACARVVDQWVKNIGKSFFPSPHARHPPSVDDRVYFRARDPLPSTAPIRPFRGRANKYVRRGELP